MTKFATNPAVIIIGPDPFAHCEQDWSIGTRSAASYVINYKIDLLLMTFFINVLYCRLQNCCSIRYQFRIYCSFPFYRIADFCLAVFDRLLVFHFS